MSTKLHFRDYNPKQMILFPQRLDKDIAENDPVRVVDAVIDNLRLDNFKKMYKERGRSPYHPKMMLKAVIYGYMNNLYSCRKIESALKRDIHFIWLAGYEQPDFNTINRFRNRVKEEINQVFTQLVIVLAEKGFITLDVEYIDGTKIESKANKYTFVWKKTTEKNRAKLISKINALLEQIDESIAQENAEQGNGQSFTPADLMNIAEELNRSLEKDPKPESKEQKEKHKERKKQIKQLREHADKLGEHDEKLRILGERNSYSKTDHDATFMRMKEDAMNNGQTKPGYNVQISTENQFITNYGIYWRPTDTGTLIDYLESFSHRYGRQSTEIVADSGYGSEQNYEYMFDGGMIPYVKYNMFHAEMKRKQKNNPFLPGNMFYNAEKDFYVCPMGQHMDFAYYKKEKSDLGYISTKGVYIAKDCSRCPLRGMCYKGNADKRTIEVNHRNNAYRAKARELLMSNQGLIHRSKRPIEPEAVFGNIKFNHGFKRFRLKSAEKVSVEWGLVAIAHNLRKYIARKTENSNCQRLFIANIGAYLECCRAA